MKTFFRNISPNWKALALAVAVLAGAGAGTYKAIFADSLNLSGYQVTGIKNNLSDNSASQLVTQQAVKAAIDDVLAAGGTTLTRWSNFLTLGGVSDGTTTGGTDNAAALQAAYNAASSGTTIYVGGNFRINSPVYWNNNSKKVHLIVEGNIYTGNASTSNSFLIIDSRQNIFQFKANINGKIINAKADLTGLTSVGIHLRHGTNNVVDLTTAVISGYEDAIRLGGVSSGSTPGLGAQYNKVYFNRITRCYRAIHFKCEGSTTDPWKSWANSNFIFGGEMGVVEGVRFTKGPDQTDPFNQNFLYNLGFESGVVYPEPMDYGIVGEFCKLNVFQNFRMEGNKVTTKINLNINNCTGNSWKGGFLYDTDLANTGSSATFECPIYSFADGRVIGNFAQGYPALGSPSDHWNGRVKIYGTTRIQTAADNIPANVDVEWTSNTHAVASSGTYVVPYGITEVLSNGATTIDVATNHSARWDTEITVINIHGSSAVTVSGYSLPAGQSCTVKNIAGNWRFKAK